MELIHPRCAKLCVRVAGVGRAGLSSRVTTWQSVTNQVLALREHLIAERVTLVVMEATGEYGKPFHHLLEDAPL